MGVIIPYHAAMSMHAKLVAAAALVLAGCGGGGSSPPASAPVTPAIPAAAPGVAFFYQDVNAGFNTVRVGFSSDMHTVTPYNAQVLQWQVINGSTRIYADPVMSRLSNGRWAMMASSAPGDARGTSNLLYHEASCPQVQDAAVHVIRRSTAAGCVGQGPLVGAKPSQVFEANGSNYAFMMIDAKVHLMRLSDATRSANDLTTLCVRQSRAANLEALGWGEATVVIDETAAAGLLLSDTGIARRTDGTWTLFVKGIPATTSCAQASLCELCARGLYRTVSTNLVSFGTPGRVRDIASVPDSSIGPDGVVWAYWQSFREACTSNDINMAARAHILTARDVPLFDLDFGFAVTFTGEDFETNTALHYPTNGNPVFLPDAAAKTAFDTCFNR